MMIPADLWIWALVFYGAWCAFIIFLMWWFK